MHAGIVPYILFQKFSLQQIAEFVIYIKANHKLTFKTYVAKINFAIPVIFIQFAP